LNYFELHIGDYAEATQHLSILEDGVYTRLLRKYYASEKPLPVEIEKVQRLIVAKSKEEKAAVEAVLSEFFDLRDDGWHQDRCDDEIARYLAGEPERVAKKANEDARTERHRLERAALFAALTAAGKHAAWNTSIKELRMLVAALPATAPATPVTAPITFEVPGPVTAPATPVTATQTPDTNPQLPLPTTQNKENTPLPPEGGGRSSRPDPDEEPEGFAAWYDLYRRKDAKRDAIKAWRTLGPDHELQATMIAALKRWKWADDRTKIPLPASWIRGSRWEDEAVAGQVQSQGPKWWQQAGFETRWDAENCGCNGVTYTEFRDGKRVSSEVGA
jgi:uncharacterized protein YdaU (DUF1376 family)